MKKIIALLMVAVLCLGLVACGGGNDEEDTGNEMDIVGTWVNDKNLTQVFKDDHTCVIMNSSGITLAGDWSYDGNGSYTVNQTMGGTATATVTTNDDGSRTLTWSNSQYTLKDAE